MFHHAIRQTLAAAARFLSGASVSWYDNEPDPNCQRVYFANHTSHIDAVIIWASLPTSSRVITRPVAAADYWNKSAFRRFLTSEVFNSLLIDRNEVKVHQSPTDLMLNGMQDEYSIIIFPEGGRGDGKAIREFKSGLYYLCKRRPELEAVPVHIHGMNRILPRGEVFPVPLLTRISFGPPIWLEKGDNKVRFLKKARGALLKLQEKAEKVGD